MERRKSWWGIASLAVGLLAQPALADIYSYKDDNGVVHFTNIPTNDKRYKLLYKEPKSSAPAAMALPVRATASSWLPSDTLIRQYSPIIEVASRAYGVDKALVHAVISAESGYNPMAISRAGARGLMQLMPDTARRYSVKNIMDPTDNIHGGVRYLKDLLVMFNGNIELAVAAYNAGENAVMKYGNKIPPYAETMHYVPKVLAFYRRFQNKATI
jgi:soluble lytic murein transglycosylase-like protein